jgi:hypothetical protein
MFDLFISLLVLRSNAACRDRVPVFCNSFLLYYFLRFCGAVLYDLVTNMICDSGT